jgi:UDP-N-acetylglucosamine 2-epimerase (non-hydrolysing)
MTNQILKSFHMEKSIDFDLNIIEKNQSLTKLTSKIILKLEKIYTLINPNAIIVQGDTTTAYAASFCAFYQKIPIFHVEAGLRTHNLFSPFPEEFNRKSIDIISNLYFASTEWAANNLFKENLAKDRIFVTGNTVVDSLLLTLNNTSPSEYMEKLISKSENLCSPENKCKIILLTCHRRENYNFVPNILFAIFQLLKDNNDIVVIFPFHLNPNIKQSIRKEIPEYVYNQIMNGKKIKIKQYIYLNRFLMISPLDYIDLVHLQSKCYFIMTDSGGIQEEGVSMGKPILILRKTTERPEAIESGCA